MTLPCKHSAAIRAGECCFFAWEPAWALPWSSARPWCRWNWPSAVPQRPDVRGLPGAPRARTSRQEDMAPGCADVVARLKAAMAADYVVLGGGNAKRIRSSSARYPAWRQSQCVPRRLPLVGRRRFHCLALAPVRRATSGARASEQGTGSATAGHRLPADPRRHLVRWRSPAGHRPGARRRTRPATRWCESRCSPAGRSCRRLLRRPHFGPSCELRPTGVHAHRADAGCSRALPRALRRPVAAYPSTRLTVQLLERNRMVLVGG